MHLSNYNQASSDENMVKRFSKKQFLESMLESLRINRAILIAAGLTTVVSAVVFILSSLDGNVTRFLQLSPTNIWGVVTSIFVHSDSMHIASNMVFLWVWTLYIVILPESFMSREQRLGRARFFVPAMFGAAIVTNIAWWAGRLMANPGLEFTSQGASGLVYAFSGGVFGFALMNMLHVPSKLKDKAIPRRKVVAAIMSNIVIVAMILGLVMIVPDIFLSKAPGNNVFAHGIGFLLGMGLVMGREYIPRFGRTVAPNTGSNLKT